MITIKNGDLFSAPDGIICHQVNCKGNMGRGVAKTFRLVFPESYRHYLLICDKAKNNSKQLLGHNVFDITENGKTCCMFAQDDWRGQNKCNTDYSAFKKCCKGIKEHLELYENKNISINMPYKIGCGLGGGDWTIVEKILEEEFKEYNLILWKLN